MLKLLLNPFFPTDLFFSFLFRQLLFFSLVSSSGRLIWNKLHNCGFHGQETSSWVSKWLAFAFSSHFPPRILSPFSCPFIASNFKELKRWNNYMSFAFTSNHRSLKKKLQGNKRELYVPTHGSPEQFSFPTLLISKGNEKIHSLAHNRPPLFNQGSSTVWSCLGKRCRMAPGGSGFPRTIIYLSGYRCLLAGAQPRSKAVAATETKTTERKCRARRK